MERKVTTTIHYPHSVCANCEYRKEKYPLKPHICTECGYEAERDEPYFVDIPVYADVQ